MPVPDVLCRLRPDGTTQFFVLEFSQNQSAQAPAPGRLLRYDSPTPDVIADDLRMPVSLAFNVASDELFVLELTGRILRFSVR
jgi:hypothetical protein